MATRFVAGGKRRLEQRIGGSVSGTQFLAVAGSYVGAIGPSASVTRRGANGQVLVKNCRLRVRWRVGGELRTDLKYGGARERRTGIWPCRSRGRTSLTPEFEGRELERTTAIVALAGVRYGSPQVKTVFLTIGRGNGTRRPQGLEVLTIFGLAMRRPPWYFFGALEVHESLVVRALGLDHDAPSSVITAVSRRFSCMLVLICSMLKACVGHMMILASRRTRPLPVSAWTPNSRSMA